MAVFGPLCACFSALSSSLPLMVLGRVMVGFGLGLGSPLPTMYISEVRTCTLLQSCYAEFAPPSRRSLVPCLLPSCHLLSDDCPCLKHPGALLPCCACGPQIAPDAWRGTSDGLPRWLRALASFWRWGPESSSLTSLKGELPVVRRWAWE